MDAPSSIQSVYYVVATVGVLVATVINLILVTRNKPDKIKAAVNSAVQPLIERLDDVETIQREQGDQLGVQDNQLAGIRADLTHAPNKDDIGKLHHRITELAKSATESTTMNRVLHQQLQQLNQFLMERGRD